MLIETRIATCKVARFSVLVLRVIIKVNDFYKKKANGKKSRNQKKREENESKTRLFC